MSKLPSVIAQHEAFKLGLAAGLADRDWCGDPDIAKWRGYYFNLLLGYNTRWVNEFPEFTKQDRVLLVQRALEQGDTLDKVDFDAALAKVQEDWDKGIAV